MDLGVEEEPGRLWGTGVCVSGAPWCVRCHPCHAITRGLTWHMPQCIRSYSPLFLPLPAARRPTGGVYRHSALAPRQPGMAPGHLLWRLAARSGQCPCQPGLMSADGPLHTCTHTHSPSYTTLNTTLPDFCYLTALSAA